MKTIEQQLSQYKSVHFNKKNVQTHMIGVPLIIWSITLMLSLVAFPIELLGTSIVITPARIFVLTALIYYFSLHTKLAIGMLVYIVPNLYLAERAAVIDNAYLLAICIFVIGWAIQFVGHYYEKAKPAFVDDISQLLIGPLFLMAELYFKLGWEKELENSILPIARDARRAIEAKNRSAV